MNLTHPPGSGAPPPYPQVDAREHPSLSNGSGQAPVCHVWRPPGLRRSQPPMDMGMARGTRHVRRMDSQEPRHGYRRDPRLKQISGIAALFKDRDFNRAWAANIQDAAQYPEGDD